MDRQSVKRQRRRLGDFLKIPLEGGKHAYARVLAEPLVAFYDVQTDRDLDPREICALPVLFRVWVMNNATTSGRWKRVGNLPLEPALLEEPFFFKQDALRPDEFSLYRSGKEVPATKEQCRGLERAAVWGFEHVEDRLRDHFAGRPNKWVNNVKLPE